MKRLLIGAAVWSTLVACESGTSEFHEITIADAVAGQFSAEGPGLLRVDSSRVVDVLCGQTFSEPAQLSIDHGFGCLDDNVKGTEVTRTAWVEPAPTDWDFAALCALAGPEPTFRAVDLSAELTGAGYAAPSPEAGWTQVEGTGKWKRDFSPCGGNLKVEYDLR